MSTRRESAKQNASRNLAGVSDPVVDALVEAIAIGEIARRAQHGLPRARPRLARRPLLGPDVVSRHGVDRPLGRFSRPERQPKLGVGAPGTWWWDEAKAKTIGLG